MALKHGFRKLDFCVIRICSFKISRLSERVPILMVEIEFTVNEHSQTPKHFGSITFMAILLHKNIHMQDAKYKTS